MKYVTRALLMLVILTGARSGNALGGIDFKKCIRTVPAERIKGSVQHRVPLPSQAITIPGQMKGLHDEFVFPSSRKQSVLSDRVLTVFLRKSGAVSNTDGRIQQHMVFVPVFGTGAASRDILVIWQRGHWLIRWKARLKPLTIVPIYWSSAWWWCGYGRAT